MYLRPVKDEQILKYIPKNKMAAIRKCYIDSDGYWIILNDGYEASRVDNRCSTIHEWTIKDLRYQIAGIRKVD